MIKALLPIFIGYAIGNDTVRNFIIKQTMNTTNGLLNQFTKKGVNNVETNNENVNAVIAEQKPENNIASV